MDGEQLARRIDHLTVNVGIAFQTVESELDGAIERAEDAMRVAASEGTNEWRIADGSRRQRVCDSDLRRRSLRPHVGMPGEAGFDPPASRQPLRIVASSA